MKQISAFLSLAFLFSCSESTQFEAEIQQVDSLQTVVGNYQVDLKSIDFQKLTEVSDEIDPKFKYLSANYVDSVDINAYKTSMGIFARIYRGLNRYEELQPDLKKEVTYTLKQLKDLKNSLSHERLDQEKAEEYLQDEIQAVQQITFQFKKIHPEAENSLYLWDSLGSRYDSIYSYVKNLE